MKHIFITLVATLAHLTVTAYPGVVHYTWFDTSASKTRHEGISLKTYLDVSNLTDGVHTLNHIAVTDDGKVSSPRSTIFIKTPSFNIAYEMECLAILDGRLTERYSCTRIGNSLHVDIDVTQLSDGLHTLTVIPVAADNTVSFQPQSAYFIKMPLGGNSLSRYCYWINDDANTQTIQFNGDNNGVCPIVELIEIPSYPLRSSSFGFAIESGQPVIYAKNRFNMWAMDRSGRISSTASSEFIDVNSRTEVDNSKIMNLEPCSDLPINNIGENEIKWFKIRPQTGDSLVFKSDRPCSIELFSPDGIRILSRSGYESTISGGCHALKEGDYYLAVHDPTSIYSRSLTLTYTHINRYAVLSHTPDRSAPNGLIFVRMTGNGLDKVGSVKLTDGKGFEISSYDFGGVSNSFSAVFDLTGAPSPCSLDMELSFFADGDIDGIVTVKNAITIEEVIARDVTVEISTERRVTYPFKVKVTITNNSNQTISGLPINISHDHPEDIEGIVFENFNLYFGKDDVPDNFCIAYITNKLMGTDRHGMFLPIVLHHLDPYQKLELVFGLKGGKAHEMMNFYAWCNQPWDERIDVSSSCMRIAKLPQFHCEEFEYPLDRNSVNELLKHRTEDYKKFDYINILPDGVGYIAYSGGGESCGSIGYGPQCESAGSIVYSDGEKSVESIAITPATFAQSTIIAASKRNAHVAQGSTTWFEKEIRAMAESECPTPSPYIFEIYTPGDPNEITGYTSISGSEHIPLDVERLSYNIEFENDPTIANSPAHLIVVEQTFAPSIYDTSTFKPTDIILSGNKAIETEGRQNFVKTFDLRPEVNAIGEARLDYDSNTGKARWTFTSLDPLTLEPTDHVMQGILPVNNGNGEGIGSVGCSISLNRSLPDGSDVDAKASIIFDHNNVIETPVWHNVTDFARPVSYVSDMIETAPYEVEMRFDGSDDGSGLWRYSLYCRQGDDGDWTLVEGMIEEPFYRMKLNQGSKYSFATIATDRAGNREDKELQAEYIYDDGKIYSGIDIVDADIAIDNVGDVFDLVGRPVTGRLSPGIYIMGNRKVSVR